MKNQCDNQTFGNSMTNNSSELFIPDLNTPLVPSIIYNANSVDLLNQNIKNSDPLALWFNVLIYDCSNMNALFKKIATSKTILDNLLNDLNSLFSNNLQTLVNFILSEKCLIAYNQQCLNNLSDSGMIINSQFIYSIVPIETNKLNIWNEM